MVILVWWIRFMTTIHAPTILVASWSRRSLRRRPPLPHARQASLDPLPGLEAGNELSGDGHLPTIGKSNGTTALMVATCSYGCDLLRRSANSDGPPFASGVGGVTVVGHPVSLLMAALYADECLAIPFRGRRLPPTTATWRVPISRSARIRQSLGPSRPPDKFVPCQSWTVCTIDTSGWHKW
jgi:hypothetical protein